jgi:hypothetical protein
MDKDYISIRTFPIKLVNCIIDGVCISVGFELFPVKRYKPVLLRKLSLQSVKQGC